MKLTDNKWKRIVLICAGVVGSLLIIFLMKNIMGGWLNVISAAIQAVAIPAAIALFVSYLIRPIKNALDKKIKNESTTSLLTIFIFLIILLAFIFLVSFILTQQITSVYNQIYSNWEFISETLKSILPSNVLAEIIDSNGNITFNSCYLYIISLLNFDLNTILDAAGKISVVFSTIITIFMTPVFLFFFLRDGRKISNAVLNVVPKKINKDTRNVAEITNVSIQKYFRGKIISMGFLALTFSTLFSIILCIVMKSPVGILYGLMFGIILACLDLIPYIGPTIGTILPMLFTLLYATQTYQLILFPLLILAADLIGQQCQSALIEPLVMSKEVEIHPVAIFSGILFFGALFGVFGVILSTPICATIKSTYRYFKDKKYQIKKVEIDNDEN